MIGEWPKIIWSSVTAAGGVLVFAAGLHGYFVTHSKLWQSAALVVGGLLLIDPEISTDFIGVGLVALVVIVQLATRKAALAPSPEVAPGQ
jgi:TRAP-type uncharacterized transport system fused permease subunit